MTNSDLLQEALAENERLRAHAEVLKDMGRLEAHNWLAPRIQALREWAKTQPDEISHAIFSCIANGAPSPHDRYDYVGRMHNMKCALEKSERLCMELLEALKVCALQISERMFIKVLPDDEDAVIAYEKARAAIEAAGGNLP